MNRFNRISWMSVLVLVWAGCDYGQAADESLDRATGAMVQAGEPVPAEAGEAAASGKTPSVARDMSAKTRDLVQQGRIDEARDMLVEALAARPGDPQVLRLLTILELIDENYESVVDLSRDALAKDPEALPFLETRAIAEFMLFDIEKARQDFQEMIDKLSGHGRDASQWCNPLSQCCRTTDQVSVGARAALAITHYDVGDLDEAERLAREILSDRPNAPEAWFALGLVLNKRDDLDSALAAYHRVLEACPACSGSLNNIGVIHYRKHDLIKAKQYFFKAYHAAGWDRQSAAISWGNIADLETLEGKLVEAEKTFREAIELSPRYAGTHFGLGVVLDLLGRDDEARETFRHALSLDPRGVVRYNAEFYEPEWKWQHDALIAEVQGDIQKARDLWRRVAAGNVEMLKPTANRHLGL